MQDRQGRATPPLLGTGPPLIPGREPQPPGISLDPLHGRILCLGRKPRPDGELSINAPGGGDSRQNRRGARPVAACWDLGVSPRLRSTGLIRKSRRRARDASDTPALTAAS